MSNSLYIAAGRPTRCQNDSCKKPFDGFCFRGGNERYYCSKVCAQVAMEREFNEVVVNANLPHIVA